MHTVARSLFILCTVLLCSAHAQKNVDEVRAENLKKADAWFAEAKAMAKTNDHLHTLPRILIDTQNATVTFKAEATGLSPEEIMEFFLIGEESGNAYEAAATALAEPKDIAKAIEMIGLEPGLPVDMAALRFWPQGERVHVFFDGLHASQLMLDERTGKTAKTNGFVFTASHKTEKDGQDVLSAQVAPPYSIAANYNEPTTILDVPFQAPQSAVYSFQVQNPQHSLPPGKLLTIRIEPEHKDGTKRVQQSKVFITATNSASAAEADNLRFSLVSEDVSNKILNNVNIQDFLAHIQKMITNNQDPFVEIHFGKKLSLLQVHAATRLLNAMEENDGLRILPPPQGSLYYKAFFPNEEQRDRNKRIAQPWELHLSHHEPPTLVQIKEEWVQGQLRPKLEIQEISIAPDDNLSAKMRELRPDMNAVFLFAPKDMALGKIMSAIHRFLDTHPFVHVFIENNNQ